MARRAARNKMRERGHEENANIHTLYPPSTAWSPLESDVRDRKYVKNVRAMSQGQQALIDAIEERSVAVALGPAGTGKTYLAIAKAVDALDAGRVSRIVLSRPAVEAGESLGFLPGDVGEKLAPYLRPLYDALTERLGTKRLKALLAEGTIEIAPVRKSGTLTMPLSRTRRVKRSSISSARRCMSSGTANLCARRCL